MILVTIGTNEQPFDRLVAAAAALDGGEPTARPVRLLAASPHGPGEWVDFLSFDELAERTRGARASSSAMPASARSCSLAAAATDRSSCRAARSSARRSTTISSSCRGACTRPVS